MSTPTNKNRKPHLRAHYSVRRGRKVHTLDLKALLHLGGGGGRARVCGRGGAQALTCGRLAGWWVVGWLVGWLVGVLKDGPVGGGTSGTS